VAAELLLCRDRIGVKLLSAGIGEVDRSASSSALGPLFRGLGRIFFRFSGETFFLGGPSALVPNFWSNKRLNDQKMHKLEIFDSGSRKQMRLSW
jgi:hypothetical protein